MVSSHLRSMASAVDQYSGSQPNQESSLIFDPTSATSTSFFKLRERQLHLLVRQRTPADVRMRDTQACVLTPSIPAGRCVGALWVAYWACPTYHLSCGSSLQVHTGEPLNAGPSCVRICAGLHDASRTHIQKPQNTHGSRNTRRTTRRTPKREEQHPNAKTPAQQQQQQSTHSKQGPSTKSSIRVYQSTGV